MCVVSMIADDFTTRRWPEWPATLPSSGTICITEITREEFDELKKEVENLKILLKKAKIYDEEHGQPDCETEDKMDLLRKLAEKLGVELEL